MGDPRNRDGIQFANVRLTLDPVWEDLHDRLEDAYYGPADPITGGRSGGWRADLSSVFDGGGGHLYDKLGTPAESKVQFQKLHGLIFLERHLALIAANAALPPAQRHPINKIDPFDDETPPVRKSAHATAQIALLNAEGIEIG